MLVATLFPREFGIRKVLLYAFGGRRKNRKKQVKTNKNRFFLVVMAKMLWTKKRFYDYPQTYHQSPEGTKDYRQAVES